MYSTHTHHLKKTFYVKLPAFDTVGLIALILGLRKSYVKEQEKLMSLYTTLYKMDQLVSTYSILQ